MRVAVTLAALALMAITSACGGSDDGNGTRLVLTDDGCTYEGEETVSTGSFTADVENKTDYFGAFAVAAVAEGTTIDRLVAYMENARQQFEESGTLPDPPQIYSQIVRVGVNAGSASKLPADVEPGTYALTCFVDDLPTWKPYVATRLEVTG